ncbi:MAG: glycosyltransferase family 4 protein [Rhodospirillaceae bacterium]|nr:glycosyltransferase family 4 protein [Rhodospirillaceae bacterium]
MTPERIAIGWQVGVPSGWGTYGVNLALELARRGIVPELFFAVARPTLTPSQADVLRPHLARQPANLARFRAGSGALEMPLLHALGDKLELPDVLSGLTGRPELGLVFFESAVIPAERVESARRFAAVVAGSSWNAEVARRHGVHLVRTCLQGVDLGLFKPGPRTGRFASRFAVFSGGKLEYRKGQDLVVAAFKRFHARHDDAFLVCAWHNPWPEAARSLAASPHLTSAPGTDAAGRLDVSGWLRANGVPEGAFLDLGALSNAETPAILREVDVALLPSRCEGGTNLVAMEAMACGVPAILSRNTGHVDLIAPGNGYPLSFQIPIGQITGRADMTDWGESSIAEIEQALEQAYTDATDRARRGAAAAAFMQTWSWHGRVGELLQILAEFS